MKSKHLVVFVKDVISVMVYFSTGCVASRGGKVLYAPTFDVSQYFLIFHYTRRGHAAPWCIQSYSTLSIVELILTDIVIFCNGEKFVKMSSSTSAFMKTYASVTGVLILQRKLHTYCSNQHINWKISTCYRRKCFCASCHFDKVALILNLSSFNGSHQMEASVLLSLMNPKITTAFPKFCRISRHKSML